MIDSPKGFFYLIGSNLLYFYGNELAISDDVEDIAKGDIFMKLGLSLYVWSLYDAIISSNRINEKVFNEYNRNNENNPSNNSTKDNKKRRISIW